MKGKVKWFGKDKGRGYIVGSDSTEYYFNVKGVRGDRLPESGDEVEFEPRAGDRGPLAHNVVILLAAQALRDQERESNRNQSSVVCPKCGKRMVPRLVFSNGIVSHSVCPFCANMYKNHRESGCLTVLLGFALTSLLSSVSLVHLFT